jgi:hypothetical protein
VTADGGADISTEMTSGGELPVEPQPVPIEEFVGFNTQLRQDFLACNLRIQQAQAAGDARGERRARADRELIADAFVAKNDRLAQLAASPWMIKDRELSAEHLQSARLGLWEAFVGTAQTADGVLVAEDGTLHPTGGWDPAKGTFSTWAGSHINGRTKRSVHSSEPGFTGMKYNTWGKKPMVAAARAELTRELGRTPSLAQIAERAGVTEDTVRTCTRSAPASLDALVSGDSATTLGDLVAESEVAPAGDEHAVAEIAEHELVRRAADIAGPDLMVLLLRTGLLNGTPRSVVQTADKLGIGRGSVGPAVLRAEKVLAL